MSRAVFRAELLFYRNDESRKRFVGQVFWQVFSKHVGGDEFPCFLVDFFAASIGIGDLEVAIGEHNGHAGQMLMHR